MAARLSRVAAELCEAAKLTWVRGIFALAYLAMCLGLGMWLAYSSLGTDLYSSNADTRTAGSWIRCCDWLRCSCHMISVPAHVVDWATALLQALIIAH